jgi:hypothetical protein
MHARYDNLDTAAGVDSEKISAYDLGMASTVWVGEMSSIYISAYFQPKAADGSTLQEFMKKHRKDLGADLYKEKKESGKALLVGGISGNAPDDVKSTWADYVSKA